MGNEDYNDNGLAKQAKKVAGRLLRVISDYFNRIRTDPVVMDRIGKVKSIAVKFIVIVIFFSIFLYIIPNLQQLSAGLKTGRNSEKVDRTDPAYKRQLTGLKREVASLSRKLELLTPGQSYLIINTSDNRFLLYRHKKLLREGYCSSGSYTLLTTIEGSKQWIFKTPKGKFRIQQKMVKPLWVRPDWSFIEEGLPVPSPNDESRYEYGVLGDYAMSLGDGYLIHGTLYKRLLGMPVTHGCVRLNDEDLEAIYRTLEIGSKVYIF
jgi:L,D-transpeptidase ErfK/SrfK